MNEFMYNQNDSRTQSRDHPSNHSSWHIPPPQFSFSSSLSTPVPHRRSMVSDNPHHLHHPQQITSSDTFVKHDSRTTTAATTKSRPLKRQVE